MDTHVVVAGESWSSNAPQAGVSVQDLQKANPRVPANRLIPGVRLMDAAFEELELLLHLNAPPQTDSELMHVLVYSFHGQSIGIIIGRIMDIVEVPIKLQTTMAYTTYRSRTTHHRR
jgi:hypothetical protein